MASQTQRFAELAKRWQDRLDQYLTIEVEAEKAKRESDVYRCELERNHEIMSELSDQNYDLLHRNESLSSSLSELRVQLQELTDQYNQNIEATEESSRSLLLEQTGKYENLQNEIDSLRSELMNLNQESVRLQSENKQLKLQLKQSVESHKKEVQSMHESHAKILAEKTNTINELSNSMSEAAIQLMEAQSCDQVFKSDLDARDKKIGDLETKLDEMYDLVEKRDSDIEKLRIIISNQTGTIRELEIKNGGLSGDIEVLKSQLESVSQSLAQSRLVQQKLGKDLDTLPVINNRLEADCSFLRNDLNSVSSKFKESLIEAEALANKLKVVDTVLTAEQRVKLNEKLQLGGCSTAVINRDASSAFKKLQVESMELRMRLVDTQAARDRAQAQVLEQAKIIARLETPQENMVPNTNGNKAKVVGGA